MPITTFSTTSTKPTALDAASALGSTLSASWTSAALGFVFGAFFANGLPHLVYGLMGLQHKSPFGTGSRINLYWGLANIVLSMAAVLPSAARRVYVPFTVSTAVGALGTALSLLILWAP